MVLVLASEGLYARILWETLDENFRQFAGTVDTSCSIFGIDLALRVAFLKGEDYS